MEFTSAISKETRCDVVVCGGGCAGVMAAIAAARHGAKTVLLEKLQLIGGTATAGGVHPFMLSYDGDGSRQIVKGLFDEVICRLEKKGGAIHPSKVGDGTPYGCYYLGKNHRHNNVTPFSSELLQLVLLEMLAEAGVTYLINYTVLDVIMEGTTVKGIIGFDGNIMTAYHASVVIDCTGDGIVSLKANAVKKECLDPTAEVQPMTTFFSVYGIDDAAIDRYVADHPEERGLLFRSYIEKSMEAGNFPIPRNKLGLMKDLNSGEWSINTVRMQNLNSTAAEDLTTAYTMGIQQICFLLKYMKDLPGCENVRLKSIASQVGIRETRRIEGVYTLEMDDLKEPPKPFEDSIAMGSFLFDLHPAQGIRAGIQGRPQVANCFQIPYRILVPRDVDGLLAAGRCVSGSRDAMSSIRVMPQAYALGEAAGVAAALCVSSGVQPRNVDIPTLQKTLVEDGAVIE